MTGTWCVQFTLPERRIESVVARNSAHGRVRALVVSAGDPIGYVEFPLPAGELTAEEERALFEAGAAGLISDVTENASLANSHYWMNAWGDAGWGFTKSSSPLVGFSIQPRHGAELRSLLARGARVRVRAVVDSRYYSGSYPYVTGVIPGASDEEVLALGHAFELGAQDNATGVAGMLEAAAALTRLMRPPGMTLTG